MYCIRLELCPQPVGAPALFSHPGNGPKAGISRVQWGMAAALLHTGSAASCPVYPLNRFFEFPFARGLGYP